MKHFLLLLICLMTVSSTFAQDVITFVTGESVKAKVELVTNSEVKYHLYFYLDGPLYTKPVSQVFSITYSNGTSTVFNNQVASSVSNLNVQSSLDTRLRRLKVWSKICRIYGAVNIGCGLICLAAAKGYQDDDDYYDDDDFDYEAYYRTVGVVGIVEGSAAFVVGCCLSGKRTRLMRENNLVGSVPLFDKEFQLNHCTIAPSINLMSYRNNPAEGIGAGCSIKF